MPRKRLPPLEKLMELFQAHSISQLAEMFQVTERTISRKIAEAKRQHIYSNPAKQQRNEQIKKMLAEGKNIPQIAKILGRHPDTIRSYAIRHDLYTPVSGRHQYSIPIGCRLCVLVPYQRGLCYQCYSRYRRRRVKKLVEYPDKLLILQHPDFTVFYEEASHRYTIHTQFFDTVHIYQPNPLEKILLDHLHREVLIQLDEAAREKIREAAENANSD